MTDDAVLLLLGPVELRLPTGPAPALGLTARGVLAMLGLANGQVVGVDQLVDGVWGEDAPAGASNALQYHVSVLRRTLAAAGAAAALRTQPPGYRLDLATDVADFVRLGIDARQAAARGDGEAAAEACTAALALWRGPALADVLPAPFAPSRAFGLEAARLGTVELLVDVELAAGRASDWVVRLDELVAENPTRERFWAQLMTALYRSGQQAAALEAYSRARHHLDEELGVDPSPALQELHRQVLAQDPGLEGPPRRPIGTGARGISVLATRVQPKTATARLVVVGGVTLPLSGRGVVVGRHPGCDVVLDDLDVSRQHLSVEPHPDGGHRARDLGSTNGSWVDGRPVDPDSRLAHGDRLRIGSTTIVYEQPT